MRPHLRPSAIWISLAAGAAVIGVAFLGHDATTRNAIATPGESAVPAVAATVEPIEPVPPAAAVVAGAGTVPETERAVTPAGPEDAPTAESEPAIPRGEAGIVISIDPETGRPGMPSEELRARLETLFPDPALDRTMEGIEIVHKPDGSKYAHLQGRFSDYTVLRITPDGRKVESCVEGPQVGEALRGAHGADAQAPTSTHEVR